MFNANRLLIAGVLFAAPVFADIISVGYLTNTADSPTPGEQAITIFNQTGPGNCQAVEYTACTNLTFTDWTLTVNYTSSYYNGTGPSEPAPFVYTDAGSGPFGGFGDITAGSSLSLPFDLCGGAGNCGTPPVTSITSVEFSGQISPSAICLYDPSAGGCNNATPNMFFASPNFDLVWDASSPGGSPYVDDDNGPPAAQSPDITVTNESSVVTPEPSQYFVLVGILCALFIWRSKFRRHA